jgi:hypothetical protein
MDIKVVIKVGGSSMCGPECRRRDFQNGRHVIPIGQDTRKIPFDCNVQNG